MTNSLPIYHKGEKTRLKKSSSLPRLPQQKQNYKKFTNPTHLFTVTQQYSVSTNYSLDKIKKILF